MAKEYTKDGVDPTGKTNGGMAASVELRVHLKIALFKKRDFEGNKD